MPEIGRRDQRWRATTRSVSVALSAEPQSGPNDSHQVAPSYWNPR